MPLKIKAPKPGLFYLFGSADATNRRTAIGAFSLSDWLAVLSNALNGILHFFLSLAFNTICLDSHK